MECNNGDLTFSQYVERCVSEDRSSAVSETQAMVPDWPSEWIDWHYLLFELADVPNGWLDRGVARRFTDGNIGEFAKFILMNARQEMVLHVPCDDEYTISWAILQSLAVKDDVAFEKLLDRLSFPIIARSPHHHFYNSLVALLRDDSDGLEKSAERGLSVKQPKWLRGLHQCVTAIDAADATSFAEGLNEHLTHFSKSFHPDPLETIVSFASHGIYRLAQLKQPDVIKHVEPKRVLPWDEELFCWLGSNAATLTDADLANCPSPVIDAFTSLEPPHWLYLPD
jgi:hypothetical protein